MSVKKVDLTDLLGYEGNPVIVIKGVELEVNTDAFNVFRLNMADDDPEEILKIAFTENSQKELKKLGLNMADMGIVVRKAVQLMLGASDDDEAPQEKASTT